MEEYWLFGEGVEGRGFDDSIEDDDGIEIANFIQKR